MKKDTEKTEKRGLSALLIALSLAVAALVLLPLLWFIPARERTENDAVVTVEEAAIVETPAPTPAIPQYDPAMGDYTGWVTANGDLYYLRNGIALTGLQRVEGKYCYFDARGVKAAAMGVDVSTYNENIDWARAKAQGIDFAIIRVGGRGWTSGGIYDDLRCEAYLRGADKAGLRLGVYFYSTAISEAEAVAEADYVLRVLKGRALELPVFYDVEMSGEFPKGRADTLSAAERTGIAAAFCKRIESAGYEAGVYSGRYFLMASIDSRALSRYTLWLAAYTKDGMAPDFALDYRLWQFTDRGNVDGILCGTDMNVMF